MDKRGKPLLYLIILYTITSLIGLLYEIYLFFSLDNEAKCTNFFIVNYYGNIYSKINYFFIRI